MFFNTIGDGKIDINLGIANHPIVFQFVFNDPNTVSFL